MEEKKNKCIGEDEESEDPENIIINAVDGLPALHVNFKRYDEDLDCIKEQDQEDFSSKTLEELIHDEDLPMSVIVTNVDPRVFKSDDLKKDIEELFKQFGKDATFQYFKSFRRMRVNYSSPSAAAKARIQLHQAHFGDTDINCYFAQPVTPIDAEDRHLQLPAPHKQFLISPPASPPLGWEPSPENEPLVNHDLLAALSNLTPGESHELHPSGTNHPGIVVHICENVANGIKGGPRIPHTRCPEDFS